MASEDGSLISNHSPQKLVLLPTQDSTSPWQITVFKLRINSKSKEKSTSLEIKRICGLCCDVRKASGIFFRRYSCNQEKSGLSGFIIEGCRATYWYVRNCLCNIFNVAKSSGLAPSC